MKFNFVIFSIIISVFQISFILSLKPKSSEICKHFIINKYNNKCKLKLYKNSYFIKQNCVCGDFNVKPVWTNSTLQTLDKIKNYYSRLVFEIYFQLNKPLILNKKLSIFDQSFFNISKIWRYFTFRNLKGFDVDLFNETISINTGLNFIFFDSSLAFFTNGRRLKTCIDFPSQPKSLFQMFNNQGNSFYFNFIDKNYQPLCPLAFSNTKFALTFHKLCDTFFKTNLPRFLDMPQNITKINATINSLFLYGSGDITLSSRILNPYVFNLAKEFYFDIEIIKIEQGLFKSLKNMKRISLLMRYWRKLAHKGLDWVYDLNSHIRVDLNNSKIIRKYFKNGAYLTFYCIRRQNEIPEGLKQYAFPDKDFCIYAKFPFEQMIVWNFDELRFGLTQTSCTLVWLLHPKNALNNIIDKNHKNNLEKFLDIYDKCQFSERLQKCNKSDFHFKKLRFYFTNSQTEKLTFFIKFIFTLSMPLICLVGILTNSIVIATVHYKPNKKEMKENQYSYMSLNAVCNLFILSFQSISLISECDTNDYGIFCSSIHKIAFLQFYRIIFVEYLTHVFYVMSNLSYICYSINRLSLIGQEHGKVVTKISKLKVKKFLLITFMFCLVLPLPKVFIYKPNFYRPDHTYPDYLELPNISKVLMFIFLSSNILYSLISSFGFILINLVVDINILRAMKQVIAERAKNSSRAIQANEIQKKKNENKSVHRVVKLIIVNATVGIILKSLMTASPLFTIYHQLVVLNGNMLKNYPHVIHDVITCQKDHVCTAIDSVGRNLILVNLAIPFFFFYKFDLTFIECFQNLVGNMKKKLKTSTFWQAMQCKDKQSRNISTPKNKNQR